MTLFRDNTFCRWCFKVMVNARPNRRTCSKSCRSKLSRSLLKEEPENPQQGATTKTTTEAPAVEQDDDDDIPF